MLDPCGPEALACARPYPAPDPARAAAWRALTQELTALRAAHVVPLLASGKTGPGVVTRPAPRGFEVRWPFHAGTLRMRLALGDALGGAGFETAIFAMGDPARDAFALEVEIAS
jgi:hypothetical protein